VQGLLIIVALFALMWFLMIRPQRAKAQAQQRLLGAVEPGDEILTVGGLYGIVQELEPEEDGGDLIVEIADGIHVRVARRAISTVVKPDVEDVEDDEDDEVDEDEDDELDGDPETDDVDEVEGDTGPADDDAAQKQEKTLPAAGVAEVNGEEETVNPGGAKEPASPDRS
jgi:preprotein translocase subunit YajC